MRSTQITLGLIGFMFSTSLWAADPLVRINGKVALAGLHCTAKNASATVSPDGTSLSVLFDKYSLNSPRGYRRWDYKNCVIGIPLLVASGYKIEVQNTEYRGFLTLASGARATFSTQASLRDRRGWHFGPIRQNTFNGPAEDNFDWAPNTKLRVSACGGSMNLWLSSSVFISNFTSKESSSFEVDSLDWGTDPSTSTGISIIPCTH